MNTLWKSFKADFKNNNGNIDWKIGQWFHQDGEIKACQNGFHGSKRIIDAIQFVDCEIIAVVEVKGKSDKSEKDKQAWSDMKIVKAYEWDKTASVKLAIFAAEQVIDIYEKEYPKDDRPRKAIEAAKTYLKNPTEENKQAARAAWAAARAAAWAAARADKILDKCEEYILKEIIPNLKEIK